MELTIDNLKEIREGLQEQHLWSLDHENRYNKDAAALSEGAPISSERMGWWAKQIGIYQMALQMNALLESLAEDETNGLLLLNLRDAATRANLAIRHPTLGDWETDDYPICPACGNTIYYPSTLTVVENTIWQGVETTQDETPQVIVEPVDPGEDYNTSTSIMFRHDPRIPGVEPCLIHAGSMTYAQAESE